jgi:hypothetical protein
MAFPKSKYIYIRFLRALGENRGFTQSPEDCNSHLETSKNLNVTMVAFSYCIVSGEESAYWEPDYKGVSLA